MKPSVKFSLWALLLSCFLFLFQHGCKIKDRPCNDCTTVTPTYSFTSAGLYVKPPVIPDITGSILKVTNLADSSVIMFDTIEPGGFRVIPVNLDSTSVNVRLDYLTSAPPPSKINPKYCPTSDDFAPETKTLIVMDVVLQHTSSMGSKGNVCTYSCSGNMTQLTATSNVYQITIPNGEYQPGMSKYVLVNSMRFVFDFGSDGKIYLYECLGSAWATHLASTNSVICANTSESFSMTNYKNASSDLVIEIDVNGMNAPGSTSVSACAPLPH